MTDEEISNLTTIDAFIQRKQPFAVYRIPGEKVPRLLTQAEGAVRLIYDLKELNGQRGFVIAPFQVSETCPVVLIQPDQWGQPLPIDNDTAEEREVADARTRIVPDFFYGGICLLLSYLYKCFA